MNPNLKNAISYDRLAGYFSSSILEVAGETIESVQNQIRVICNSDVEKEDVEVAKLAKKKLIREWRKSDPERKAELYQDRFKKLYELLKSGKMQVKVMPDSVYGLVHGKAGIITRKDGTKVAFLGSVNETKPAWLGNYELLWADESQEGVEWTQREFDLLWNSPYAIELCDAIVEDIGRLANRKVISLDEWRKDPEPASVVIESPAYKDGLELWNHQKYFIKMVFEEHLKDGARYILADGVGLGKTAQLAIIAELIALVDDKPVLIIVPKTLLYQWQEELKSMWGIPSAVYENGKWITENGHPEEKRDSTKPTILQCPRKIAIISHGLIVKRNPEVINALLSQEYSCVIVDEAHKARRKEPTNVSKTEPTPNNLMEFLLEISTRTKSLILATATPIQLHPIEGWDLLYILAAGNKRYDPAMQKDTRPVSCKKVLGDHLSKWLNDPLTGIDYIAGKKELKEPREYWNWIRNPLPPAGENKDLFGELREILGMRDREISISSLSNPRVNYDNLDPNTQEIVKRIIREDFFKHYNPFIRFMVRRRREMLETTIDPVTGKPYLEPIKVRFAEGQEEGLVLSYPMQRAYELALEFTSLLKQRGIKGFYKNLLLRRIGSSIKAGLTTAQNIFSKRAINEDVLSPEEADELETEDIPKIDVTGSRELECLQEIVELLSNITDEDPKYNKIKEILINMGWIKRGCLIFSEYYDTASSVAERLSRELPDEPVGIYAGTSNPSGIYRNGKLLAMAREEVKELVMDGKIKVLVGTDAAGEGLNLQMLGSLINVDLPWNPVRLEQRLGRIRRAGQVYEEVWVYNLFYRGSVEEEVQKRIRKRKGDSEVIIGPGGEILPPPEIKEIVDEIFDEEKSEHPFDLKYREHVGHVDFESCARILNDEERIARLMEGWV